LACLNVTVFMQHLPVGSKLEGCNYIGKIVYIPIVN
jgi:hypothetical protein